MFNNKSVMGLAVFVAAIGMDAKADIVHADDVIVQGSHCVGVDCVDGETFSFDTIRLKENNLRIHFEDTSASSGFPTTDWRIIINDTANGGADHFSIEDATAVTVPFRIEGTAPTNSLVVDDTGRIGLGTNSPVVEIHSVDGNTPTLRFEQDNSGGWTPQTWDMAGNEANFFIRDVTNGSKLPFRIKPGAPTSSIHILDGGNVGMGTSSADSSLHVLRSDGTAAVKVEETNGTTANRVMLELENNGAPQLALKNSSNGAEWRFSMSANNTFQFDNINTPGAEWSMTEAGQVKMGPGGSGVFDLRPNGNLIIAGSLTQMSDVNSKTNIKSVDRHDVLNKVAQIPINKWTYKDDLGKEHLGPMAQDFHAAFGLNGDDNRHISTLDMAGVSFAAIQALNDKVEKQEQEIAELKSLLKQALATE